MAQFFWSLVMLILGVGFGGFYLAKQLGWFGLQPLPWEGLTPLAPGRAFSRWGRQRRLVTAVLLMVLGVLCFVGVNWLDPREHLRGSLYFLGSFIALFLVTVVFGWQEWRELRRLTRRASAGARSERSAAGGSDRPQALSRDVARRLAEPGGDGGRAGESPAGREGEEVGS